MNLKIEIDGIIITITATTTTIYTLGVGGSNSPFLLILLVSIP